MLQGLSKYTDRINRAGLQKVEYAPLHQIDVANARQVVNDQGEWLFAIPFLSGDWLEMEILPIGDGWQQSSNETNQGEYHEQVIRGFIKGFRKEGLVEASRMLKMRFVVKLTDKNDQVWLIGSLEAGLAFSYVSDTGETGGRNGLTLTFTGLQQEAAAIYKPL